MSITFACGHCGKSFTIEDRYAGRKGKCKQCGAVMQIPTVGPSVKYVPGPPDRQVSPARRAPAAGASSNLREVSSSRRVPPPTPEPQRPPRADVYGFDDDPPPLQSAVTELDEDDFEPIGSPRLNRLPAGAFDPPRKKKKKKNRVGTAIRRS